MSTMRDVTPGKTTVTPEVLLDIVRLEVEKVPGVYALAPVPGMFNRILRRSRTGVRLTLEGEVVDADVHVILEHNVNLRQTAREIQKAVAQALERLVGFRVGRVNVYIEDLHIPAEAHEAQPSARATEDT